MSKIIVRHYPLTDDSRIIISFEKKDENQLECLRRATHALLELYYNALFGKLIENVVFTEAIEFKPVISDTINE
jgi:hypothetical protein